LSPSLRTFLDQLRQRRSLYAVKRPVHPKFELGTVLKKTRGAVPILFEKVTGHSVPVVSGICGSRESLALALGCRKEDLIPRLVEAITRPSHTLTVTRATVHENVLMTGFDIGKLFPIPTFHEKDSAPFLTAGLTVAKDPALGRRFSSIRRMQLNGPNNLSILIESPGLLDQYYDFERQGKPLPVAIVLGVHPILTLSSQLPTQTFGLDKMNVASALAGEPIPMVKCRTIDLEIPAESEIVFEGSMVPRVRHSEGPFGELMGYYGPQTEQPTVEVKAVTFRDNPMLPVVFPSSDEHKLAGALMRELILLNHVRHVVPTVKDVYITMNGGGRCHAFVSIRKTMEGQGKEAILAALASNKDVKLVVVVDEDVDVFNLDEVEWAIATRMQADQDVVIIPGAQGTSLEPSHTLRGVSAKMGIDATYPIAEKDRFQKARIPSYEALRLEDYLVLSEEGESK
jgi:2,5-furandicarboxylate decarboxylase 1